MKHPQPLVRVLSGKDIDKNNEDLFASPGLDGCSLHRPGCSL